jgi:tetratricopeptide (TPR) repeat protein
MELKSEKELKNGECRVESAHESEQKESVAVETDKAVQTEGGKKKWPLWIFVLLAILLSLGIGAGTYFFLTEDNVDEVTDEEFIADEENDAVELEELFKEGLEHYESGDYSKTVECWQKAAERGHADAQFNLGLCYDSGQGVSQDYSEAVKWYRKAAEQGDADAQNTPSKEDKDRVARRSAPRLPRTEERDRCKERLSPKKGRDTALRSLCEKRPRSRKRSLPWKGQAPARAYQVREALRKAR